MHVPLDRVMEEDEDGESAVERLVSMRAAQAAQDNKVRINVGGIRHETYKSTLRNIPDTRLAWMTTISTSSTTADYDPITCEFFFDRHPTMFEAVLNYYRTGKLHAPTNVCGPAFEEELTFWGIDEKQIEPCCWSHYTQHRDAQETLHKLQGGGFESDDDEEEDVARIFGIEEACETEKNQWYRKWQPRIWTLLEEPYSSRAALIELNGMIDKQQTECLNESDDHRLEACLKKGDSYLESDCDEQLIITMSFQQNMKLHSLKVLGPTKNGPKVIKLFINQPQTLSFDAAERMEAVQELTVTPEQLAGEIIPLRFVKFQNVQNVTIFVMNNQDDEETTTIQYISFIGTQVNTTNMNEFKRVAGKKGESH